MNCFSGDTEVLTEDGVATLHSLAKKGHAKLLVVTPEGPQWKDVPIKGFGTQKVCKVEMGDGSKVYATLNHQWIIHQNGRAYFESRVNTSDLMDKSLPLVHQELPKMDMRGYAHGFVFGDGWVVNGTHCKRDNKTIVRLFKNDKDLLSLLENYGEVGNNTVNDEKIKEVYCLPGDWKKIPENPTKEYALGFVMGLAAADGNVRNTVRIHNASETTLLAVQKIARHAGLRAHTPYLDREISPFDGSEKPLYSLTISTWNLKEDHFIRNDQKDALVQTRQPITTTVVAVEDEGIQTAVFCAQVPEYHNFVLANGVVTGNCWNVAINDPVEPFCFTFNELMLGGGVGYNIQQEQVFEIPKVKFDVQVIRRDEKDVDYIVPDNREGWVDLLRRVLTAFFVTGKSFTYSTICIRGKGTLIHSFGGTASGPEDLCKGINEIVNILKGRAGDKLRPVDCLDILNIIGSIVVAGNVRRSAQLALGDMNDVPYLDAKNWSKGPIPNWRAMSNNSVACNKFEHLPPKFWGGYNGEGEAYGLINLKNCRNFGRLVDGKDYRPDKKVVGTNPCGEVTLESYESCNLSEIFLPNIKDKEDFIETAILTYKITKTISCLPFIHAQTNAVVGENHRLGNSVTGFLQARPELRDEKVFDAVYKAIEKEDKAYSKILGVKPSIKLTTVKPSGTLSLLAGVTPGVHPAYAPQYIRRIRMASGDALVQICKEHGYHVEPVRNFDGTQNWDTMVVSFPIKVPEGTVCAKDLTAVQQLEYARWLQTHWADNSVSVTVYYRKEELESIKDWLEANFDKNVKTVSFLLHNEHGFAQAPYEEITEEQFKTMSKSVKQINRLENDSGAALKESLECSSGACPVK